MAKQRDPELRRLTPKRELTATLRAMEAALLGADVRVAMVQCSALIEHAITLVDRVGEESRPRKAKVGA